MADVIARTGIWCEPNPNSQEQGGYDPLNSNQKFALEPGCCPCDDCPHRVQCRDEGRSCQVFDEWVNPWRARDRAKPIVPKRIPGKRFLKPATGSKGKQQ